MRYCDVTPTFALHTATCVNARIAGLGDETGTVEEGKCADLIITTDNPLEDVCALRHVDMVMTRGKLIRNPQVKKIEACERELDKFI